MSIYYKKEYFSSSLSIPNHVNFTPGSVEVMVELSVYLKLGSETFLKNVIGPTFKKWAYG